MARFGFNSRRYEMLMSALLVYATRRTANCVALAILIGSYQLVNDIRAHGGNASMFAALHSRAPGHSSTSGIVSYSFGWIVIPGTRDCLSWHWISWRLLPLNPILNNYFRWVVIWQQENGTVLIVSLCRRVFLKLNRHILHWTQCTLNWNVTRFCHCQQQKIRSRVCIFDFYWLTYLVSSLVVPH